MNITVLGCGRWGTFLAWYFNSIGHSVLVWGRNTSEKFSYLETHRQNEYVKLPAEIKLSNSLSHALMFSDIIVIAIKEQNLRDLMEEIIAQDKDAGKSFLLCMKGLENTTGKRLSEVVYEYISDWSRIAVMVGPAQPTDLINGIPACMVIDSYDKALANELVLSFNSELIHYCVGDDLIGNEVGAAINKIIGIAGGILDGLGYSSLKGPLMVMGTKEIASVIHALGGNPYSAYGLCCLGDYQASLFSEYSNSVAYGKAIVGSGSFTKHAPGAFTAHVIANLAQRHNLEIPLLLQVASIILGNGKPIQVISLLIDHNTSYK